MKKLWIIGTFLVAVFATGANTAFASFGTVVSNSGTFSLLSSPDSTTVSLDLFDPALGTLNMVTLRTAFTVQANVTVENLATMPIDTFVSFSIEHSASAFGLGVGDFPSYATESVSLAAADGTSGSGPDFYDFGLVSGASGDIFSEELFSGFASFIGSGSFDADVILQEALFEALDPAGTVNVSDFEAFGTVTVEYDFTPVPEPSALAGLSLISLLVMMRRRRII